MKKRDIKSNKKIQILSIVLLTFLAVNILFVVAQPISSSTSFVESKFFKTIKEWVVPSDMEGVSGMIVGIVALAIIFAIMYDIVMLVAPFSSTVNTIIAVGLGILMILFKWNLTLAGWVIGVGASIFGFAAGAAAALTIILAIAALFFIFFGGLWLQEWITGVKGRRQILEATAQGYKQAAAIRRGKTVLTEAGR